MNESVWNRMRSGACFDLHPEIGGKRYTYTLFPLARMLVKVITQLRLNNMRVIKARILSPGTGYVYTILLDVHLM